jgi:GNAT superfamily N-acetyltransferase
MIRKFKPQDVEQCVNIVNMVWDFDIRFNPKQLSNLFKRIYTEGSLANSNFAVVVEENNAVQGFLFGKCGNKNLITTKYSGTKGNIKFLYELFSLKGITLKRKFYFLTIIGEHEKNRRTVEHPRENEVNLFAVNPNCQGKGYGKLLMNSFIDYCKQKNVNRITLDTDQECNYGFYDYLGFKIKGKFYSPLQKEYSGKSGESYVYELNIKDN